MCYVTWARENSVAYAVNIVNQPDLEIGSSVQFSCSVVSDSLQLHGLQQTRPPCPSPPCPLPIIMSIEWVMPSNHLILCHPLLLPSIFPSIRVFSSESSLCIRWQKYSSFSISPSNEYSGWVSFRIDLFDLLAVQGTLKSLLNTTVQKHQFLSAQPSLCSTPLTSLHDY